MVELAYLADIFDYLNSLNELLQENETNVLKLNNKMNAFTEKVDL